MTEVYALWHRHEDEMGYDHDTMLGIYSTRQKAEQALAMLRDKPGFVDHPGGFEIDDCTLDKTALVEGFVTIMPGEE